MKKIRIFSTPSAYLLLNGVIVGLIFAFFFWLIDSNVVLESVRGRSMGFILGFLLGVASFYSGIGLFHVIVTSLISGFILFFADFYFGVLFTYVSFSGCLQMDLSLFYSQTASSWA
ncbi:MAG: hypothetical protein GXO75_10805 [Calditrichaeota bacterium]|nr:hypothetical protein [Calditrichota bacterium]